MKYQPTSSEGSGEGNSKHDVKHSTPTFVGLICVQSSQTELFSAPTARTQHGSRQQAGSMSDTGVQLPVMFLVPLPLRPTPVQHQAPALRALARALHMGGAGQRMGSAASQARFPGPIVMCCGLQALLKQLIMLGVIPACGPSQLPLSTPLVDPCLLAWCHSPHLVQRDDGIDSISSYALAEIADHFQLSVPGQTSVKAGQPGQPFASTAQLAPLQRLRACLFASAQLADAAATSLSAWLPPSVIHQVRRSKV